MFSLAEFTSRDAMDEADRSRYAELTSLIEADLRPVGALEVFFAAEILRATWRIQHCSAIDEATLADTAARSALGRERRAAAQSIRWALSELRKLQTDRGICQKLGCERQGLAGIREILKFTSSTPDPTSAPSVSEPAHHNAPPTRIARITERTQFSPRNAPCSCGSGEKYKRCCGKTAVPVPGDWRKLLKDAA